MLEQQAVSPVTTPPPVRGAEQEIIDAFRRISSDPDFQTVARLGQSIGPQATVRNVFERIAVVRRVSPEPDIS